MSASAGPGMTAEDIHAFTPARSAPLPARRARRVWPWVLGGLLLLALLLAGAATAALMTLLDGAREGLHVIVDDESWAWHGMDGADGLAALLGIGVASLMVLLVVPLIVLFGLLLGGLGVALGLALTLGAVGLVLALVLSPLWLVLLLIWLLLRPARR
jgi:hypothetical protein